MITVEPTCRFCKCKLVDITPVVPNVTQTFPYPFECKPCRSVQFFDAGGRPGAYWFHVGDKYVLHFNPINHWFAIRPFEKGRGTCSDGIIQLPLLELHVIPFNLTPQNTTEERIKTLILFS